MDSGCMEVSGIRFGFGFRLLGGGRFKAGFTKPPAWVKKPEALA